MPLSMQLITGKRYAADIELGFLEALATNDVVKNKLEDAGFRNVLVNGTGKHRTAMGTWNGPTRSVDLPSQIRKVRLAP